MVFNAGRCHDDCRGVLDADGYEILFAEHRSAVAHAAVLRRPAPSFDRKAVRKFGVGYDLTAGDAVHVVFAWNVHGGANRSAHDGQVVGRVRSIETA